MKSVKNGLLLVGTIVFFCLCKLQAQTTFPYGINYQSVLRDAVGNAQTSATVPIQFSIRKGSTAGNILYQERQLRITNSMGQFNAVIGTGSVQSGVFQQINWSSDSMFLQVEIFQFTSFTGTVATIGIQKFQAVPYALYARTQPITVQRFLSGSGTYSTPAGAAYIRIRMVGGGGGASNATASGNGASGGVTTFGTNLLIAGGGAGGNYQSSVPSGGSYTVNAPAINIASTLGGDGNMPTYVGSTPPGGSFAQPGGVGASSFFGGAGGAGNNLTSATSAKANSGSGGGGACSTVASSSGGTGGAAGAYVEVIINNPQSTYAYSVGTGGLGAGSGSTRGGDGGSGVIIIEEHY